MNCQYQKCGKEFAPRISRQRFCSLGHARTAGKAAARARRKQQKSLVPATVVCPACKSEFKTYQNAQKFCSKECRRIAERKRYRCAHSKSKYCRECGLGICSHGIEKKICRHCNALGWAKKIILRTGIKAEREGYRGMDISPEALVLLAENSTHCVLCKKALDWSRRTPLHHNHETGKVIGFTHTKCNLAEGRDWYVLRVHILEERVRELEDQFTQQSEVAA
jgi:hypothetical protein